ncbi:ATP-binding protein [Nocardioides sp.]|uniref:ATP-binding protein n=1 Tax=Nocardioides sp. TaxID=35761 RepID=UPI0039E2EB25
MWADEPPANPTKALQVVVSRARGATSPEAIERTSRGYRLALEAAAVDAWALRPEGLRLAAEGRYAEALPLLERAEADDDVVAALLRAVAAVQGVPAALERYEAYREDLADRLGVDPSPALRGLHAELLARDRPVRSGVHYDADRLIGRDADVAALQVLVKGHRLVSIVGAGGLGKTRLAHLLARQAEQPAVHFVELAGVTSADGVAVEVADVLGVRESVTLRDAIALRGADLLARIVDAVGTVPSLLVLDNCEHLVEAVADLVSALLSRTPALTVLTTTRTPLGLSAERVYLLPELSTDDGLRLFTERAVAARPGVVLVEKEVRELVERLDGLPLAVELAAAKVRAMSVTEIARRLDNRFALLRGGSRDAPERHQTLLAVIDWSWNLLGEEERVALRRLAVFRDGFSLEGATAVLGQDSLDLVLALAAQSLVVVRESDGEIRYRLLETVREFGRMQLVDAGDDAGAEQRLRAWAVDLATLVGRRLNTPDQILAMRQIRTEEGNLVDVARRGLADADVTVVAPIFSTLSWFWMIEGSHLKVMGMSQAVEDLLLGSEIPSELADAARSCLASSVGNGAIFRGTLGGPGLDRLRELGTGDDPQIAAMVRIMSEGGADGMFGTDLGNLEELVDDPDRQVARLARMWIAHAYENRGDLDAACELTRRALELCGDDEGPWMRTALTTQLSGFAANAGDVEEARRLAAAALPDLWALGAYEDHSQTRAALAILDLRRGRLDEAERTLAEVEREEGARSVFGGGVSLACGRAELLLARGEVAAGLAAYATAVAEMGARGIPGLALPPGFEPWVLYPQAALLAASVRHHERAEQVRDSLIAKVARSTERDGFPDVPIFGCVLFALAVWEASYGDKEAAAVLLAYADRFAFSRLLPSFDWDWATSLVTPAEIGDADATELREPVRAVLAQLQ